ncbi:hypothetical protein KSP40_PGU004023 [Platanthera guangdongensis]|uniref:Uncharacterized protein n=1 Tax=Platanthera guangdongensis TaxID=2320717 RepID=A0ABR2N3I8_9ASPA
MQSDDWAVLIADAKARNCFKDSSSIPKEFMGAKGSAYTAGKVSSNNVRSFRNARRRLRHVEMKPKNKTGRHLSRRGETARMLQKPEISRDFDGRDRAFGRRSPGLRRREEAERLGRFQKRRRVDR